MITLEMERKKERKKERKTPEAMTCNTCIKGNTCTCTYREGFPRNQLQALQTDFYRIVSNMLYKI